MSIENVSILKNPDPPAPNEDLVVRVTCSMDGGGRRTDFYFAGNQPSAEHLVRLLKGLAKIKN